MRPTGNRFWKQIRIPPSEFLNSHPSAMIDLHAQVQVKAPRSDRLSPSTDARRAVFALDDRIGAGVHEGGAGDEVNR